MNVLIVGKGGREHALAYAVARSPQLETLYAAPGNPGMSDIATLVDIDETDFEKLIAFAKAHDIDLTLVGPEVPLAEGIVDAFEAEGLKIFGPDQKAAQVESSKDFAKQIMKEAGIPTAGFETFDDLEKARAYIIEKGAPIVIKEDGLKAGKGVTVAMSLEGALRALEKAFEEEDAKVVIEDYLDGFEYSLICLVNGDLVVPLEVAQDHKRLEDGDLGPNTGGMGAYSPVSRIDQDLINRSMEQIMVPMAKALQANGTPFKGFLYGGLMDTEQGPQVIEFNARFGDPEAEVILARLDSDFLDAINKVMDGQVPELAWNPKSAHGVVLASSGYPASSTKGASIRVAPDLEGILFHMGTRREMDQLFTDGGRVLMLVQLEENLKEAMEKNYEELKKIESDALFYRTDIGKKDLQ